MNSEQPLLLRLALLTTYRYRLHAYRGPVGRTLRYCRRFSGQRLRLQRWCTVTTPEHRADYYDNTHRSPATTHFAAHAGVLAL